MMQSMQQHRMTTMIVTPAVLDLLWKRIERGVEERGQLANFERVRRIARRLPMSLRRRLPVIAQIHQQFGGDLRLFLCSGAFLPPLLQQAWEDIGVLVLQGYGTTETGSGVLNSFDDHPAGTVGRPVSGVEMRIAEDGEIQFRGPTVTQGYWEDPEATAAAFTKDGWYRTGDLGRLDEKGRLVLHGRKRDMIVLPSGFNVFPEDIENALRVAGLRETVVLETEPGRIEAIVLANQAPAIPAGGRSRAIAGAIGESEDLTEVRRDIDARVRAANATLAAHSRIAAWRFWPDEDFPRTHTMKIKRNEVRAWAAVSAPLAVREAE
jgi:long-chain acyl-CoA synthetase